MSRTHSILGACAAAIALALVATAPGAPPQGADAEIPADLKSMRKGDMEALARDLERGGKAERARELRRRWLDAKRRNYLSEDDADGRITLAEQYLTMLDDRQTAATLLKEALAIDPHAQRAADALTRLGYEKVGDAWAPRASAAPPPRAADPGREAPRPDPTGSLRGLTRGEVRARLGGKPNRIARVASQGQILEQWIFEGPSRTQYINFIQGSSMIEPSVKDSFTLP